MRRRRLSPEESKQILLDAAVRMIAAHGVGGLTLEAVSSSAGSAKGLVSYHFKSKKSLLEAAAGHLAAARSTRWARTIEHVGPETAMDTTWRLLSDESVDGSLSAWTSLFCGSSDVIDREVINGVELLAADLGRAADGMFGRVGVRLRVGRAELGRLLAALVVGVGCQLLAGCDRNELEAAYAAAWLGVLSLAESSG